MAPVMVMDQPQPPYPGYVPLYIMVDEKDKAIINLNAKTAAFATDSMLDYLQPHNTLHKCTLII